MSMAEDIVFSAEDLARRARARLSPEPPARTLPSGAIPGGDHALNERGLTPEAIASARPAAVLVPIVAHAVPTVLLTQRTAHLRKHSGQVAFPGGKIDGPGESELEAALRRGVLLRPLGDVIVLWPPLAISLAELDRIAAAVERGIVEATKD